MFCASVSYDVTASAHKSLLQWLLELHASFFSYPHSNTRTRLQKYVSIYVHMHTERQIQSDSALRSTCLISFQKLQHCFLFLFKMPKASFSHIAYFTAGVQSLGQSWPIYVASAGLLLLGSHSPKCLSEGQDVGPPFITQQLGLTR